MASRRSVSSWRRPRRGDERRGHRAGVPRHDGVSGRVPARLRRSGMHRFASTLLRRRMKARHGIAAAMVAVVAVAMGILGPFAETAREPPVDISLPVPPEFVYLGTPQGGAFVTLSRIDLTDPAGRVVPAYRLHIMAAHSTGRPYGQERIGRDVFRGIALYLPPEDDRPWPERYVPPDPDEVLGRRARLDGSSLRAWVNYGALWVAFPHRPGEPQNRWLATILPAIRH